MRSVARLIVSSLFMVISFAAAQAPDDLALMRELEGHYASLIASGGRYMEHDCIDAVRPDWERFPLRRCTYTHLGVTASVTMLNPTAERLAQWTVTACRDALVANMKQCTHWIRARIWSQSNGQFPISGFVVEPSSVIGRSPPDAPLCFLFRNGIVIRTSSYATRAPTDGKCGPETVEMEPVTRTGRYARIASTTLMDLINMGGFGELPPPNDPSFAKLIANEWQEAWGSTRNRLLSAIAISEKSAGRLR